MSELKGLIIHASGDWAISETKSGFHLYKKDGKEWELEDEMSKEGLLNIWLRNLQGGVQHDVS